LPLKTYKRELESLEKFEADQERRTAFLAFGKTLLLDLYLKHSARSSHSRTAVPTANYDQHRRVRKGSSLAEAGSQQGIFRRQDWLAEPIASEEEEQRIWGKSPHFPSAERPWIPSSLFAGRATEQGA